MSDSGEFADHSTDLVFELDRRFGELGFDPDEYLDSALFKPRLAQYSSEKLDGVGQFLSDAGKYELLTHSDEIKLAKIVERGLYLSNSTDTSELMQDASLQTVLLRAERARESFINANLRLVPWVYGKKFGRCPAGIEVSDLLQEGVAGLSVAVDRFDYRKGFKFSTYAQWWIRQKIARAIDNTAAIVRLPVGQSESLYRALRESPDGEGQSLSDKHAALLAISRPLSLERSFDDDGDMLLRDVVVDERPGPEDEVVFSLVYQRLIGLMGLLEDRDRQLVIDRLGLESGEKRTFEELGRINGFTGEAARRRYIRATQTLQRLAVAAGLDEVLMHE
jgi:RNA polymerase primary sigma factor